MPENRIREFRLANDLTLEELSGKTGISVTHLSRMETGKRGVSAENAQRIADVLQRRASEVLGLDLHAPTAVEVLGYHADLVPYQLQEGDPFGGLAGRNRQLMKVNSTVLGNLGIGAGDVVVIDTSPAVCKSPPAMSAVRAIYRPDPARPHQAIALLRQFIPPTLLITNSDDKNTVPINMSSDVVIIDGVIISTHRALRG